MPGNNSGRRQPGISAVPSTVGRRPPGLLFITAVLFQSCSRGCCVCVVWLFIFKDTEPSPLQASSGARQKGDLLADPFL